MAAKLTFRPLGTADCTRIDFADGKKTLVDYADMLNDNDPYDKHIDLPAELKADLRTNGRDNYDIACFTHLDDDHCCREDDFFWLDHTAKDHGADASFRARGMAQNSPAASSDFLPCYRQPAWFGYVRRH